MEEDEEEEEIKLQIDLIVSWRNFISLIRCFSRPSTHVFYIDFGLEIK